MRVRDVSAGVRMGLGVALAAAAWVVPGASVVRAADFEVTSLADDGGGSERTLREAMLAANDTEGPDTITFAPGLSGTITLTGGPLTVVDHVVIDGAGADITVSGADASRVIRSTGFDVDLSIRNLHLTHGFTGSGPGGAVWVNNGRHLSMVDVIVTDSTAEGSGGGLAVGNFHGQINIFNSVFEGNTSVTGDGGGIAIETALQNHLINLGWTEVTGNTATSGDGGGFFVDSSGEANIMIVSHSTISDNAAPAGAGGGAALKTSGPISVDATDISDNTARNSGGLRAVSDGVHNVRVQTTSIVDNSVPTAPSPTAHSFGAGVISATERVELDEVTVTGNEAFTGALGVSASQDVSVEDSTISDNGGGGVFVNPMGGTTDSLRIERSSISRNDGPLAGLVTRSVDATVIEASTLADNDNTDDDAGGGVTARHDGGATLSLLNSTVSGNTVAPGTGSGGIWATGTLVDVRHSTIVGNVGSQTGGVGLVGPGTGLTSVRSILAGNSGATTPDTNGPLVASQSVLGTEAEGLATLKQDNVVADDPLLGALSDHGGPTPTHLPRAESPAVDADMPVPAGAPAFDQRGFVRPVGRHDVGAVERQPEDVDPVTPVGPGGPEVPGGPGAADGSLWIPVEPRRLVDTRPDGVTADGVDAGIGERTSGSQSRFVVAGRAGVPSDAIGVIANLTGVRPSGTGYMTVHGCVEPVPLAASLNYTENVNLGDEVVVALNDAGEMCVLTSQRGHLTIDVVGYVPAGSEYRSLTPARLLDTRAGEDTVDGVSAGTGAPGAGGTVKVAVQGRGGVPSDARSVMVYVAAIRGADVGYVTLWDCDAPMPLASTLNFVADTNRGNEVVATPGASGELCVFTSADVDITVDVVGYLPAAVDEFEPIVPSRFLDTRAIGETVDGSFAGGGRTSPGEVVELDVAGRGGVPFGAHSVTVNFTAIQPIDVGYVTVFPCLDEVPLAASLNYVPGVNGGNELIAQLDDEGRLCVFTSSGLHLTADVTGYAGGK